MSHLLARIMLALIMLPLGGVVYTLSVVMLTEIYGFGFGAQETVVALAGVITGLFVAVYWIALWRGTVRWTRQRVALTILATVVALGAGLVAAALIGGFVDESFGVFIGGVLSIVLWLALTVLVWRETRSERVTRLRSAAGGRTVVCPSCGYNLTGLRQSVCPECGVSYTLEELMAAQPAAEQGELG